MKKIIYLFSICFLLSALSLNAQKQFPDSSFEKDGWKDCNGVNGPYVDFRTTFFYTLNEIFSRKNNPVADITAHKDGDAQHGMYCIKLISGKVGVGTENVFLPGMVGTLNKAFIEEFLGSDSSKVTVVADWAGYTTPCALEGWYKYKPVDGDSAVIELGFQNSKEGAPIVFKNLVFKEEQNTWKPFSIPIPQEYWKEYFSYIRTLFVASAHINWDNLMQCTGSYGSTLWIDNIILKYDCETPGEGIEQNLFSTLKANAYPNPASEILNIELNENFDGKVVVYNIQGSKFIEENIKGTHCVLNTSTLATGNYIYRVMSGNTIFAQGKFVISK